MTVAEELAHCHLHMELIEQIDSPERFKELQAHPQWHELERNAKRYAAALLTPGQPLSDSAKNAYAKLVSHAGTRNSAAIRNGC
jgi:Zn-dependent peptidase ImmA (M78 family)